MWIFLDIDGVLVPEKNFEDFVSLGNPLQFAPVCLNEFENVLRRYPQVLVSCYAAKFNKQRYLYF
jgi:hypothetical protein